MAEDMIEEDDLKDVQNEEEPTFYPGDDLEKTPEDSSIYSSDVRESMLDGDELSPYEEAFMNGFDSNA